MQRSVTRLIYTLLALLLLTTATGCNDYVFVEKAPLPAESDVNVEADNTFVSILIDTDNLAGISANDLGDSPYLTYYDSNGDEVPKESPLSERRQLRYDDVWSEFSVGVNGSYLYFDNSFNCSGKELTVAVQLYYQDPSSFTQPVTIKTVRFHIAAGPKLEHVWTSYEPGHHVTPDEKKTTDRVTFRNDSPESQRVWLYPYRDTPASALVTAEDAWAEGAELKMSLPVLWHDEWGLHDDGYTPVLGSPYEYTAWNADFPTTVEVPAYTTAVITTTVDYVKYVERGALTFYNPVTKQNISTPYTITVHYPASYDVTVETVE